MPTVKPTKPTINLPTAFGTSPSNVKTEFSAEQLLDGYSASIPQILDGGNLNYLIDMICKSLTWSNAYADWYDQARPNTVPYINSSNQLDYESPVFGGADNNFTGTNTFVTQQNSDSSQKVATTAYVHNILNALYPVGSLYIGTQSSCPLATLIAGSTWSVVATDRALWGGNGSNGNSTIAAGLPNITGNASKLHITGSTKSGVFSASTLYSTENNGSNHESEGRIQLNFNASKSNTIYGGSTTVQPPAYRVNVWRRTA